MSTSADTSTLWGFISMTGFRFFKKSVQGLTPRIQQSTLLFLCRCPLGLYLDHPKRADKARIPQIHHRITKAGQDLWRSSDRLLTQARQTSNETCCPRPCRGKLRNPPRTGTPLLQPLLQGSMLTVSEFPFSSSGAAACGCWLLSSCVWPLRKARLHLLSKAPCSSSQWLNSSSACPEFQHIPPAFQGLPSGSHGQQQWQPLLLHQLSVTRWCEQGAAQPMTQVINEDVKQYQPSGST